MFQGMHYVYEVYKEMSFSKAARNLFISQPSLSAAVKKEEKQIGFHIFYSSSNLICSRLFYPALQNNIPMARSIWWKLPLPS